MGTVDALNADLLRLVFANLDAPRLALAGCVCRAWHDIAMDDAVWMERCRERLPALAVREGAVRLYRWLDQQEAERATMRDGLDDAQQGREQASRRAARISADLAATELQASAELRMFERRAEEAQALSSAHAMEEVARLEAQLDELSERRANGVEKRMRAEVADIASQLARVECIADAAQRRHEAQLLRLRLENTRLRRELCAARAALRAAA